MKETMDLFFRKQKLSDSYQLQKFLADARELVSQSSKKYCLQSFVFVIFKYAWKNKWKACIIKRSILGITLN